MPAKYAARIYTGGLALSPKYAVKILTAGLAYYINSSKGLRD